MGLSRVSEVTCPVFHPRQEASPLSNPDLPDDLADLPLLKCRSCEAREPSLHLTHPGYSVKLMSK